MSAEPDNDTLRSLGAFDRKCRVGKHQATNWVHLRQTIETLDAAGQSDAADTLIWVVWHEVNGTARAREYHDIACRERDEARAEATRLAERLEDKTSAMRTEIAAKVGAYREIKMLEDGIREILGVCEGDARDQSHNSAHTSDKRLAAYAEGRGTACRGIASRLRELVSSPSPAVTEGSR